MPLIMPTSRLCPRLASWRWIKMAMALDYCKTGSSTHFLLRTFLEPRLAVARCPLVFTPFRICAARFWSWSWARFHVLRPLCVLQVPRGGSFLESFRESDVHDRGFDCRRATVLLVLMQLFLLLTAFYHHDWELGHGKRWFLHFYDQLLLRACYLQNVLLLENPPTPLWRWRRAYWGANSYTKCWGRGPKTISHCQSIENTAKTSVLDLLLTEKK